MNKIFNFLVSLSCFVFLLSFFSFNASAVNHDRYLPNSYNSSALENIDDGNNMAARFLRNLLWATNNNVNPETDADVYGWYKGLYFGLASWERDICSIDLSTNVRNFRDKAVVDDSDVHYTTTITATGIRTAFFNYSYYEASWFIQPFGSSALFRAYLFDGVNKEFVAGKDGASDSSFVRASQGSGGSGYQVVESGREYSDIILEYKYSGSTEIRTFKSRVVMKRE